MISSDEIQRGLKTELLGKRIDTFEIIDSTNTAAKKLAERGAPEGTVVIAEYQTDGRGRFHRKWHGEPEKNLLLSLILRPHDKRIAPLVTYLTALSAADAVQGITGITVECKWPNDLLINDRKFCGILLESSWKAVPCDPLRQESMADFLVIGVGMNVNQEKFPTDLCQTATSLKIECGREFDRASLIRDFFERLERGYLQSEKSGFEGILRKWKMKCRTFGKEISVEQSGKILKGKAIDLSADGALLIEDHDRLTRVFAGDVRVLN
jgi:BirA family biotin operon repressor/biotin-[acetyl-CoA-carboxylase] ligase